MKKSDIVAASPSSKQPAAETRKPKLPHERDEAAGPDSTAKQGHGAAGESQRRLARQAAKDLAEGQVDTDLHATPGLDARRRDALTRSRKPRG